MKENENTQQVQGGQTSTVPPGNLASSTAVITDLAGGRGFEINVWKAKKAWLLKSRVRFLQDILECGGIKVGSCRLTKEFMCQVIKHSRIPFAGAASRGRPQRGVGGKTAQ